MRRWRLKHDVGGCVAGGSVWLVWGTEPPDYNYGNPKTLRRAGTDLQSPDGLVFRRKGSGFRI